MYISFLSGRERGDVLVTDPVIGRWVYCTMVEPISCVLWCKMTALSYNSCFMT